MIQVERGRVSVERGVEGGEEGFPKWGAEPGRKEEAMG